MNSQNLIAAIAADWTAAAAAEHDPTPGHGAACSRCAASDLLSGPSAALWPHTALHRLVAPIEEVLDAAVESYVAPAPDREQRLRLVDDYRDQLRTTARDLVDRALERGRGLGLAAS